MRKATAEPETKVVHTHKLTVTQTDDLGTKLAALPISNKDRDLVADVLIEHLGISDSERFLAATRETDVPTPKT